MDIVVKYDTGCNWGCKYCHDEHAREKGYKPITTDTEFIDWVNTQLLWYTKQVGEGVTMGFMGGEPGVWSTEVIDTVLSFIEKYKYPTYIYTNGLILKDPSLVDRMKDILNLRVKWHIATHMNGKEIPKPEWYDLFGAKRIAPVIVTHLGNLDGAYTSLRDTPWISNVTVKPILDPTVSYTMLDYVHYKAVCELPCVEPIYRQIADVIISQEHKGKHAACTNRKNSMLIDFGRFNLETCYWNGEPLELNRTNWILLTQKGIAGVRQNLP